MWDEIQDMQGEIFDVCENTGMLIPAGSESISQEMIDEMHTWAEMNCN
jgi:hypothetical protein